MLRALRVRKGFTVGLICVVALLATFFVLAFHAGEQARDLEHWVAHTEEVMKVASTARLARARLEYEARAYAAARDESQRQSYEKDKQLLLQSMTRMRNMVVDNPVQIRLLDQLDPIVSANISEFDSMIQQGPDNAKDIWTREVSNIPARRALFDQFERNEEDLFKTRVFTLDASIDRGRTLLLIAGTVTLLVVLVSGYLLQRELVTRANVEVVLRRAHDALGVRFDAKTVELHQAVDELHKEVLARRAVEQKLFQLNEDLEDRVRKRTAELNELNHELEAFNYSVSHDLRAPLRHLDGFSRILEEEFKTVLPEDAKHYLSRIRHAATHLTALVEDLLRLSRTGRKNLEQRPISLKELIQEAKREAMENAAGREIQWKIADFPDTQADAGLLRQVFINLFANAVKFTRNTDCPVIEVGCRRESGMLTVFVKDNGAGFDPQFSDKLFGVFQRLHRQDEFEGTGIGLAMVQRIVHKHGGRAWADSTPGEGATFYFSLPLQNQTSKMADHAVGATA